MEQTEKRRIVVNRDRKKLLKVDGVDLSEVKPNQILDLSEDGDRWEGDVLNDEPFGWGVLYDSEGRMVYEGFRMGEVNVCYGRSYYSDVSQIEYEGEIYEGMRWGRGIHYDRSGSAIYDGEWIMNSSVLEEERITPSGGTFHNHIRVLVICDESCNEEEWSVFDFGLMPLLKSIRVSDNCFECVNEVKMVGLNELESVVIGNHCFTQEKYSPNAMGHFYLKDCPKLRELKMGRFSFSDYTVIEIENVDALEVIEMGDLNEYSFNFPSASLELKSILIHSE